MHKTNQLAKIIENNDKGSRVLFIHGYELDPNFERASKAMKRIEISQPNVITN